MTITICAEGQWSYADACAAMADLKLAGIEASVTGGGLSLLLASKDQAQTAKTIVENHNGWLCAETLTEGLDMQSRSKQQWESIGPKQDYIRRLSQ